METKSTQKYLVDENILPEAMKKTMEAKALLASGQVKTIHQAVEMVNLSRSAYYKYKDRVELFFEAVQGKICSLSIMISHEPGVLSRVLQLIARENGSIITINQGIPLQEVAYVTLSFETVHMRIGLEAFIRRLKKIKGVQDIRIIGQE